MFLTPHFTLKEMTFSQAAVRNAVPNDPDPEALANLRLLCEVLEQVRALVGSPILITSAFRNEAVNQLVGGVHNSAHRTGLAADICAKAMTARQLAECIRDSSIAFDQLILEFDSWVHLAISLDNPRRQVMTVRKGTGYLPGLQ
ncbi:MULTISPECIES: D-Ala-D-Ala carboxypeptidase family metallohydrolase [unclassified Pseudomonas]|uniref:D-Ala-D-Ala carboxypeptidase family metallohydrolase n=1 Tax=Pseudomonas TaxID=286 RepID=UPI0016460A59|nr:MULTISPECIES: D-Ala-D-Ala carboxypeptidase family metallohydrolase [unclassified Pseudomonas]MBC3420200.1 peptidase M15 [Pseudomonas sp. RW3S2]MBC3466071.1 peptidase M15 [Pseudomonas sp. RW10S2]QXI42037.1 peptidase M15 [Pseudomonas wayambapalatensis]